MVAPAPFDDALVELPSTTTREALEFLSEQMRAA
jgi:hypothetical protein